MKSLLVSKKYILPLSIISGAIIAGAVITADPAYSFVWQTFPHCYKATGGRLPGFVLPATSCNSGVLITPVGPVPMPDCGPFGALCTVPNPTSCLNAICAGHPNAIYNPKFGICGCG